MNLEIIDKPFRLNIHGFSAIAENKYYTATNPIAANKNIHEFTSTHVAKDKRKSIAIFT